jgi:hypothetical protein
MAGTNLDETDILGDVIQAMWDGYSLRQRREIMV